MVDALFHQHELNLHAYVLSEGQFVPGPMGSHHALISPCGVFKGPKGYIVVLVLDRQWPSMAKAIGRPDLISDPRFATGADRGKNQKELIKIIEDWMASHPSDEAVLQVFEDFRIAAAPVITVAEAVNHPYFKARDMVRQVNDPIMGELTIPGFPLKFSAFPELPDIQAPMLGQHGEDVLRDHLGYTASQIADLRSAGHSGFGRSLGSAIRQARFTQEQGVIAMKFGLLYISDYDPDRYKSASHYYGEILEQIQYQEELGFDGVFFAEHYVGGYAFPSPPVFAAAVAQRTKRIRLGTGVTLLPLNNPIRTAEEYAMLDVLSNGRLDFGVGRGVLKAEYELFGIAENESQGRFHESLEIILQAWTQDSVTFNGKYYKINDVKALPKPVQQPYPPVWTACAVTPESFTWAGRHGFNPMIVPFAYPKHEDLQAKLNLYWSAAKEAGHDISAREVTWCLSSLCRR